MMKHMEGDARSFVYSLYEPRELIEFRVLDLCEHRKPHALLNDFLSHRAASEGIYQKKSTRNFCTLHLPTLDSKDFQKHPVFLTNAIWVSGLCHASPQ